MTEELPGVDEYLTHLENLRHDGKPLWRHGDIFKAPEVSDDRDDDGDGSGRD